MPDGLFDPIARPLTPASRCSLQQQRSTGTYGPFTRLKKKKKSNARQEQNVRNPPSLQQQAIGGLHGGCFEVTDSAKQRQLRTKHGCGATYVVLGELDT